MNKQSNKPYLVALFLIIIIGCFFDYSLQDHKLKKIETEVDQIQNRLARQEESPSMLYETLNQQYLLVQNQSKRWVAVRHSNLLKKIETINLQITVASRALPNSVTKITEPATLPIKPEPLNLTPPPSPPFEPIYEPQPTPSIVRRSEGVIRANTISKVDPVYPQLAKTAKIEGDVKIELTIDESGQVITARILTGHPLLQQAALSAAKKWRFKQTLLNGIPVKVAGVLTFRFKL